MIPVNIANDGTVKKADITKSWYNYTNKQWANVVLVTKDTREKHITEVGDTVIPSADILAYLVWIPRYSYAIPSGTGARAISIKFGYTKVAKENGTATGTSYLTHPGFTFGTNELNGLWVGKF